LGVSAKRDRVFEAAVARALAPSLGDDVWYGPFAGKVYTKTIAEGFVVTKLPGCYEQELHPAIEAAIGEAATGEAAIGRVYGTIVNIRGAEGYYAIGLACATPTVIVHAFGFLNFVEFSPCLVFLV
jgi:hypothetical protein